MLSPKKLIAENKGFILFMFGMVLVRSALAGFLSGAIEFHVSDLSRG